MNFFEKNKVLIVAFLGAALLALQEFRSAGETDLKVMGFALFIILLGILGNSWKGQGLTITGIIGTVAYVAYTSYTESGVIELHELIMSSVIALLSALLMKLQPDKEPPSPASLTNKPA